MTKKEHIIYWIGGAEKDWKRVNILFKNKDYVFCLFCAHLCLEKLCKAIWVKNNTSNYLPKIHNLLYLLQRADVELTMEQQKFFKLMNDFQLEGRYPDYKFKIYKFYNKERTREILTQVNPIRQWLLNNLQ